MNRIKELMEGRGWTIYRLAKEAGHPHHRLSQLVDAPEIPPHTRHGTLKKVASALGVGIGDLEANPPREKEILIVIPGESPPSWNKFYAGAHWSKRHQAAADIHQIVRAYIDPDWPPFTEPVEIEFTVYFENRRLLLDWSNIPAKIYEDGLIGWLIPDDNPEFVVGGHVFSRVDRENPRIEMRIYPSPLGLPQPETNGIM